MDTVIVFVFWLFLQAWLLEEFVIPRRYKNAHLEIQELGERIVDETKSIFELQKVNKNADVEKTIAKKQRKIKRMKNQIKWCMEYIKKYSIPRDLRIEDEEDAE